MTKIEAIIKPFKLEDVLTALHSRGLYDIVTTDVHGTAGVQRTCQYRGVTYNVSLVPRTKVELTVDDSCAAGIAALICHAAHTGARGDGKIFLLPVGEFTRPFAGETPTHSSDLPVSSIGAEAVPTPVATEVLGSQHA